MTNDPAFWNSRLLFASVCVLLGTSGFVAARSSAARWMPFGLVAQGVLMAFVAGASYFHRSAELRLGGLVIAGLLFIFSFAGPKESGNDGASREDRSL